MWPVDPNTYDNTDGFQSMKPPRTYPHTGIDFIVPTGTPVVAVQPGVITAALTDPGNGLCIAQSLPNGRYFSYIHLSQILVKQGQSVAEGQIVGVSGATGSNCRGAHLHNSYSDSPQVYVGRGNLQDPYEYLQSLIPPTPPQPPGVNDMAQGAFYRIRPGDPSAGAIYWQEKPNTAFTALSLATWTAYAGNGNRYVDLSKADIDALIKKYGLVSSPQIS